MTSTIDIHANRMADLLGGSPVPATRPDAIITTRVAHPPSPPVAEAKVTYFAKGYFGQPDYVERENLYEAVRNFIYGGIRSYVLTALATTYDADGEPDRQWKCEYDDEANVWEGWK